VTPEQIGGVIARLLTGAWRLTSQAPELDPEAFEPVAPVLHRTGAGALIWWRIRGSALAATSTGEGFQHAYRLHTLQAELYTRWLTEAVRRLDAAGVEALLIKGWSVARRYPEPGLRPYSDLDFIIRPGQLDAARAAFAAPPSLECAVDLHDGPSRVDPVEFDALVECAETASLGSVRVRMLGPEDHLRLLAMHALRHGVFRPLWLVDLAVCVEGRRPGFDWDRCLGPASRESDWVLGAIALSERLLGASTVDTPAEARAAALPAWFVRAVLRNWGDGTERDTRPVFDVLIPTLRRPRLAWAELRRRWDRPIETTLRVGGSFNPRPRWPYQAADLARRTPALLNALRRRMS
jgi:hypothetical protein